LATKHIEGRIPKNIDEKFVVDIDLSILGQLQERFDEYEKNIKKEYSQIPEEKFKGGRKIILKKFLDRQNIYFTDFFRKKYELQARENLERTLSQLK